MVDSLTKQKEEMAKFQEAEMLKHLDLRYKNEIIRSMEWLAEKDDTIFLGQAVNYSGNAMFNTTKYPPSLLYILMTIGPSLILLSLSIA